MFSKKHQADNSRYGNRSITKRLWFTIMVSFAIFSAAFFISMFIITERARWNNEIKESETIINGLSSTIDSNIEIYKSLSRLVVQNEKVLDYLREEEPGDGDRYDAKYAAMEVLNVCNDLDSVFMIRNDLKYVSTGHGNYNVNASRIDSTEWKEYILKERGKAVVLINTDDAVSKARGWKVVTIARAIYDIYTQKLTGILLMNISVGMLEKMVSAQDKSEICLVTENGAYLAGDTSLTEHFSSAELWTGNIVHSNIGGLFHRKMLSACQVDGTPIVIMCITEADITSIPAETVIVLIVMLLAYLIAILIAASFISRDITSPILALSKSMEKTTDSGYMEQIKIPMPDNEIGLLADTYNGMIVSLHELFNRVIEKEKTVRNAEMKVLHEQIKPHFLYNSLETISYMAVDAGAEEVHNALETLGGFYRNFLSRGDREIPLKREITIIKDYLTLQKMRYGEEISDEYDIADDVLDLMIPKLILQPLVENSINHGIRLKGEPGLIRISARLVDGSLHIKVYDTGVGMSREVIDTVLTVNNNRTEGSEVTNGFGLKGTIDRIRYYCDDDDVVRITSEEGEYTEIELVIPTAVSINAQPDNGKSS